MNKKTITILTLTSSIILVLLFVIRTTYSLIINVTENNGINEIVGTITIRDLITDENGMYIKEYYDTIDELNLNPEEVDTLIDSTYLNNALNTLLKSVVDYRLNNKNKLSNSEISSLIIDAVDNDRNINNELKNKVITKTNQYIADISDYLYGIKTSKEA